MDQIFKQCQILDKPLENQIDTLLPPDKLPEKRRLSKTFVNFKKTDWDIFKELNEDKFLIFHHPPKNTCEGARIFWAKMGRQRILFLLKAFLIF